MNQRGLLLLGGLAARQPICLSYRRIAGDLNTAHTRRDLPPGVYSSQKGHPVIRIAVFRPAGRKASHIRFQAIRRFGRQTMLAAHLFDLFKIFIKGSSKLWMRAVFNDLYRALRRIQAP